MIQMRDDAPQLASLTDLTEENGRGARQSDD